MCVFLASEWSRFFFFFFQNSVFFLRGRGKGEGVKDFIVVIDGGIAGQPGDHDFFRFRLFFSFLVFAFDCSVCHRIIYFAEEK